MDFTIEFTKEVVFKDWTGTVTKVYAVGDRETATHDNGHFYVTSYGGIYHDEAKKV